MDCLGLRINVSEPLGAAAALPAEGERENLRFGLLWVWEGGSTSQSHIFSHLGMAKHRHFMLFFKSKNLADFSSRFLKILTI